MRNASKAAVSAVTAAVCGLAVSFSGYAQAPESNAPRFEVVSVKQNGNVRDSTIQLANGVFTSSQRGFRYTGQRVTCNHTLGAILQEAFSVEEWQIKGPEWLKWGPVYEIIALMPAGAVKADAPAMLRAMLAERFALKFHREQRDVEVYALVEAKGGTKLKSLDEAAEYKVTVKTSLAPGMASTMVMGGGRYQAPASRLSLLVHNMATHSDRPIVDLTGLKGVYNIDLQWTPDEGAKSGRDPGFLSAIPQLGLRLEKRTMPFEIVVIDSVENTPTEN
jgi:uncharacterized protein (TIGR03435 family)